MGLERLRRTPAPVSEINPAQIKADKLRDHAAKFGVKLGEVTPMEDGVTVFVETQSGGKGYIRASDEKSVLK